MKNKRKTVLENTCSKQMPLQRSKDTERSSIERKNVLIVRFRLHSNYQRKRMEINVKHFSFWKSSFHDYLLSPIREIKIPLGRRKQDFFLLFYIFVLFVRKNDEKNLKRIALLVFSYGHTWATSKMTNVHVVQIANDNNEKINLHNHQQLAYSQFHIPTNSNFRIGK